MDRDAAVRRCRALLAKATSSTFPAEAAACRRKADLLLASHGLTKADLVEAPRPGPRAPQRPAPPRHPAAVGVIWGTVYFGTATTNAAGGTATNVPSAAYNVHISFG